MNVCVVPVLAVLPGIAGCTPAGIASFGELDRDRNGRISQQEARVDPQLAAVFDVVDENGDGELTAPEYLRAVRRARG